MAKVQVFQNFITQISNEIYQILFEENVLDGVKFPGIGVDNRFSQALIKLIKQFNVPIDNHGWKGISAQLHDSHFADNIMAMPNLAEYLNLPGAASIYSSHIGAATCKLPAGDISQEQFDEILLINLSKVRETFLHFTGTLPHIYGEGVFPYYMDPRTIHPHFLNCTLKAHGLQDGLDGLVLDLCHANIACDFLSKNVYHKPYTFEDYLKDLDCSQVGIIHCSGGYGRAFSGNDCDFSDNNALDPHISSILPDWKRLIITLNHCPNAFRVSNEIAYSDYKKTPLTAVEYCKEAILTRATVECRSILAVVGIMYILEELHDNCDNLKEIIQECKCLYL